MINELSMKRVFIFALLSVCVLNLPAQFMRAYSTSIRSMQMVLNDDWREPPVMRLHSDDVLQFSFDEMSHTYHRYIYRITHCRADWSPTELFDIDFLDGFNEMPIEEWENSVNTTLLYTNYTFTIPNEDVYLKLSGNYIVEIIDDEEGGEPVAVVQDDIFSIPSAAALVADFNDDACKGGYNGAVLPVAESQVHAPVHAVGADAVGGRDAPACGGDKGGGHVENELACGIYHGGVGFAHVGGELRIGFFLAHFGFAVGTVRFAYGFGLDNLFGEAVRCAFGNAVDYIAGVCFINNGVSRKFTFCFRNFCVCSPLFYRGFLAFVD